MARVLLLLSCLAIVRFCVSESESLPMAVLSPDETEVVTFNVDANGNDTTLQLNCSGVGSLTWYRGTPPAPVTEDYVTLITDNNLSMLTISPVRNNTDADGNGIPYFCIANNTLGQARSRTVLVKFAFFDGFEASNTTTDVTVRLGEAVALKCGVLGAAPTPDYVWFSDNTTIDTTTNTDKIRTLDDGATLVIYNLLASDTAPLYSCGVTNARMFDTEVSTRLYRLVVVAMFSTPFFVAYRVPPNETVVTSTALASGVTFYYIGATNGANTELFSVSSVDTSNSANTLSVTVDADDLDILPNLLLSLIADVFPLTESSVNFKLIVIEPLVVLERPSNTSTIYNRFTNESINFTCNATGTGTTLQWYHNTEKLSVTSNTLVLDTLVVDNAGVYQCFWEDSEDGTFALDTWALTIQVPEPPNSFTITSSPDPVPNNPNRTIVPTGSSISLTLKFIADDVMSVDWFRTDIETDIVTQIQFPGNELYNTTGAVLDTGTNNEFTVIFTIINVNNVTSGYYYAVIEDSRTPLIQAPTWFVSEQVNLAVVSLTLSPYNCLLEGVSNQIQCVVNGLPDPTLTFETSFDTVVCPINGSCTIDTVTQGDLTTSNLTFNEVSAQDEGTYQCTAVNSAPDNADKVLEVDYSPVSNTLQFCTWPTITEVSPDVSELVGVVVTLRCQVDSTPSPDATWYKNGEQVMEDERVDITRDGGDFELTLNGVFVNDTANYTCSFNNTRIPQVVMATILLEVNEEEETVAPTTLPVYIPIAAAVGGALILIVVVAIILVVCICCCLVHSNKKRGSYTTGVPMNHYTDGRGNVDKDSDEEEDHGECQEAFQPQYESLPAIRPIQPPEYKPSPSYNNQFNVQNDDFDMMKPPIPDDSQTPHHYHPQQFFSGDNGGMAIHGSMMQGMHTQIPIGSSMGLQQHHQPRFDDFASDDEKFV